ncbi:MAG: response regulator transcription factor [Chloroflexi bacterium]|nr:response regulator transcription factor [Chloroflexota bacterium]
MLRILLADDHALVRRGLEMVLRLEPDFELVGSVANGADAIRLARECRPDLAVLDLKMPRVDGIAATREIKRISPQTRIILLTGIDAGSEIAHAVEAGADGYVLKEVEPQELIHAIRTIAAGEAYLQPAVTKQLLTQLRGAGAPHPAPPHTAAAPPPPLTPREMEILQLMATSATNREIAEQLVISEETVRKHTKNILAKLDQPNRTQAVLYALRQGLIQLT